MKTRQRLLAISALFVAVLLVTIGMLFYSRQVNTLLATETRSTMKEIAAHDMASVVNTLDRSWSGLVGVGDRIRLKQNPSLEELQKQLNAEQTVSLFRNISLIDDTGKMYSGSFLIRDGTYYPFVQKLLNGGGKTVQRFNEYNYHVDDQQEALMYAAPLEPFVLEGIRFIGIVGRTEIQDVREHMNLTSFGGKGLSSVLDSNGNYIVNPRMIGGIGYQENLYTNLETAVFEKGCSLDVLKKKLAGHEQVTCSYRRNGTRYILYMQGFDVTDWYMTVIVPYDVFDQQSGRFVRITVVMMGIVLLLYAFIIYLAFRMWRQTAIANANALAQADFLNRMSHEIRTPLNALIGLNYLMRQNLGSPDKVGEYLEKSESTSQYLLNLINNILDISKLNQSTIELLNEPFSLAEMKDMLRDVLKDRMEEKKIDFEIETELLNPVISGDEMRLKQVLLNILGNAVKFTPAGGRVVMRIHQEKADENRVSTLIDVADTGIGMSDEFKSHVFESFRQESRAENSGIAENSLRGTGLGMAISYLLMQQMGGEIRVKSTLGKGSCFSVVLTTKTATEEDLKRKKIDHMPRTGTTGNTGKKKHVLVAEDNQMNADILSTILEDCGCSVEKAENGQLALSHFLSSEPGSIDLILMDARMPVMDGYEAARKIRETRRPDARSVRIYACTANTGNEDRTNAKDAGMNGFLAKPIDIKQLMEIVNGTDRKEENA